MNDLTFSSDGWADYLFWQTEDARTLKRINRLIRSILREGLSHGEGKPEPLKHRKEWSRRIDA
jgi:toxin YoeB